MVKTWQEELKNETYKVGRKLHPGGNPLGWGEHYEVKFTNGCIALIDSKRDTMQAVQVPGKRGHRLYVNGQTHWKKWGKFRKGSGIAWTGRKTWTDTHCPWRLWQFCKTPPVTA